MNRAMNRRYDVGTVYQTYGQYMTVIRVTPAGYWVRSAAGSEWFEDLRTAHGRHSSSSSVHSKKVVRS